MNRFLGSVLAVVTTAGTLTLLPTAAAPAAPITSATFAASARGDGARVNATLLGIPLADVGVAPSRAGVDQSGSTASTANLAADVAGVGVATTFTRQSAPPTAGAADAGTALGLNVPGVLGLGALSGSSRAAFPVGGRCLADGTLSRSTATTGSLAVGTLVTTTALTTTSTTSLVAGNGSLNRTLRSTATAGTVSASALGVAIGVSGTPSLTVDAGGTPTYTPGTVTVAGSPLAPGTSRSIDVGLNTLRVTAASNADVRPTANGGAVDVVSIAITLTATGSPVASVALNPLSVSAQAPAGGLDCTPDAPTISTPANGSTTSDATPTITGTGTPGATVTLRDGTDVLSSAVPVGQDGRWTYTPTTDLTDGSHTVSATQTLSGATSTAVSTTFTVDATAPAAPVIQSPADGSSVGDGALTVSGTGEPGARLTVTTDGATSPTITVGQDGRWQTTLPGLGQGEHRLVARQRDAAGNDSADSAAVTVTVDTLAPAAPVLTAPADGTRLSTGTVTVRGTGEAGATVTVREGTATLCTARVGSDGSWACEVTGLADGSHVLGATQADAAGNTSPASATRTVVVDSTSPAAPVVTVPADGTVQRTRGTEVSGTAEPGASVRLSMDGGLVRVLTADAQGRWSTDLSGLTDGTHVFTATQTDAAGNVSPASEPVRLVVDTVAPARPVISTPADGAVLTAGTVAVTGTGEPRATLTLSVDGAAARTVTVGDDGRWTTTVALDDGTHALVATQADAAGNVSTATPATTVRVDTTAPAAPVLTAPADGTRTNDTAPAVTGTGEPGSTVTVRVDGAAACTAPVGADGSWSCVVSPALTDGPHDVTATQTDAAGLTSPATGPVRVVVDTDAPGAPVISAPADGTVTTDRTPIVSGTGEPGARVTVRVGTRTLCTTTVSAGGTWSCEPTVELPDGDHALVAVQTDAAGNGSAASTAVTVTVDGTAPPAPAIESPADGSTTRDATPEVTGTGEPGATVVVRTGDRTLCTTTVEQDGAWSCDSADLADGPHDLVATQTDGAGVDSSPSPAVTVTVDTRAPGAPVIQAPADGTVQRSTDLTVVGTAEPRATVTLTLDGTAVRTVVADAQGRWATDLSGLAQGPHVLRATQADAAGNLSGSTDPVRVTVDTGAPDAPTITDPTDPTTTADATPVVSGRGEPGSTVTVREGTRALCTATVQTDGTWSCTVSPALDDGAHVLEATQVDEAGNVSAASAPLRLLVDTEAPDAPVITAPEDGTRTTDATPEVSGTGVAGEQVVVSDGTGELCSTTVGPDGTWTCTSTRELTDGTHVLTATQRDEAGNVSAPSDEVRLVVDSTAPAAPVVSDPADGSTRTTSEVTVSGTGEAGAALVLRVDGSDRPATRVGDDGRWSVDLTGLADGPHTVTAVQTDTAGNASSRSDEVTFTVDTRDLTAPDAPRITRPADEALTDDRTPEVGGTGEPGATVTVRADGDDVCTATVDADGTWSCTVAPALGDGPHVLTAVQSDEAGNGSPASTAVRVTVDGTAPDAPTITAPEDGLVTRTRPVPVSGTAEPGSRVTVRADGGATCTATTGSNGRWTCTTAALPDGTHQLTAVATDPAGNVSEASQPRSVVVDATAPVAPAISTPANGTRTADTTPLVGGTGEPGARVTVRTGSTTLCSATVDGDGRWQCETTAPLTDGSYPLVATQADRAGNTSPASASRTVVVDTTAPAAPVIASPADGSVTGLRDVTVRGTGEPGARLVLTVDGTARPAVTVGSDGRWTVELTGLTDREHALVARQSDTVGNGSGPSGTTRVTVDTRVPGTPVITSPRSGTTTIDNQPTVTGTGQPGARVVVMDGTTRLCETDVPRSGTWTCTSTRPLSDGGHNLVAMQQTAGGSSPRSSAVALRVTPPATPRLTAPGSTVLTTSSSTPVTITGTGTPRGTVTVRSSSGAVLGYATVNAGGRWSLRTRALRPGSYRVSATQVVGGRRSATSTARSFRVVSLQVRIIKGVDPTKARRPLVRGTGTAGATVVVRTTKGKVLGKARVGSSGRWSLKSKPLKKGRYSIRATQSYAGRTTTSNVVTFRARPRSR